MAKQLSNTHISAHLTWDELACHDEARTPYPRTRWNTRAIRLASVFEGLRTFIGGKPMRIGSGYRTPAWNRKQGGAPSSQHVQGRALDPHRPKGMQLAVFHRKASEYADTDSRIGGIGFYRWGVHIDTRPRKQGRLVVWNQVPAGTAMHDTLT